MSEKRGEERENEGLFAAERAWLSERFSEGLAKVYSVFEAFGAPIPENFDRVFENTTLEGLREGLRGGHDFSGSKCSRVFRSWFTNEEWEELGRSSKGIQENDVQSLKSLKQARQRKLLSEARRIAIDLTRDESESEPATACASALGKLLNRVGASRQAVVAVQKDKRKKKQVVVIENDPPEEMDENEDEEKGEEEEEEEPLQKKKKRQSRLRQPQLPPSPSSAVHEKGSKKARGEKRERPAEESIAKEMKEKMGVAELEVNKWLALFREGGDRTILLPEKIEAPSVNLAEEAGGRALLADMQKWNRYLCVDNGGDERSEYAKIQMWGAIFKWWRLVERCFVIHGLFLCLRGRQKRGTKIQDRYAEEARRRNDGGKAYSFSQASRFDRIGKMLLEFPKLMFQTQFVTQADWFQVVDGKPLLDCVHELIAEDKIEWWRTPADVAAEEHEEGNLPMAVEGSSCDLPALEDSMDGISIRPVVSVEQQSCGTCNDKDQLWIFCDHVLSSGFQ